jgi:hypothetical protein
MCISHTTLRTHYIILLCMLHRNYVVAAPHSLPHLKQAYTTFTSLRTLRDVQAFEVLAGWMLYKGLPLT